jgi:hypothetical protein
MRSARLGAVALAFVAMTSEVAHADPPPSDAADDRARAQALFDDGKRLMEQKDFAQACRRLAESDSLDPTVSTIGLLAACHQSEGKVATAYGEFLKTAIRAESAKDERADYARRQAAALEPRVPKLVISVAKPITGLAIFRDGQPVAQRDWGTAVDVDPGEHEIVARAPRKSEFRAKVSLPEAGRASVEVPDVAAGESPAVAPAAVSMTAAHDAPKSGGRTAAALVAGGVGLVGVGVGAAFGLSAIGKNVDSRVIEQTCRSAEQCEEGRTLREETFTAGTISTASFAVGLVGLGVATVLLLTTPSGSSSGSKAAARVAKLGVTPGFNSQSGGVSVTRAF